MGRVSGSRNRRGPSTSTDEQPTRVSNLDRYKKDLESLILTGDKLELSIQAECRPEQFESAVKKKLGAKEAKGGNRSLAAILDNVPALVFGSEGSD